MLKIKYPVMGKSGVLKPGDEETLGADVSEADIQALLSLGILYEVPDECDDNCELPESDESELEPELVEQPKKINLNECPVGDIELLEGVGAATAKKIVEGRPYTDLDSLKAVAPKVQWGELGDQVEF